MAGAGVPVSMDDGAGIAAAPEKVCPLPGVARSGQKGRWFFAGDPPRPICRNWWGVGNAVRRCDSRRGDFVFLVRLAGIALQEDLLLFAVHLSSVFVVDLVGTTLEDESNCRQEE